MSVTAEMLPYGRLAAPREDRALLVVPSWQEVGRQLAANRGLLRRAEIDLQGRGLRDLSGAARRQLLADALAYTRQYRDVASPPAGDDVPIVLAGHQPQLFHPGVWCKNFALDLLARQQGAVAVNLLVDSDRVKHTWSRVPGGSLQRPTLSDIAFDAPPLKAIAYEEQRIVDPALFESFGRRAAEAIAPVVSDPLLSDYWPLAVERARATGNLGLALAQSRHQLEAAWGLATLELPQSHYCQGEPFWYFTAHLLARLPRLWDVHNASLVEFRKLHRIRSATHPAPDLAAEDDWLEAPFWIWTNENPHRRRLFVRAQGDTLALGDRTGLQWSLDLTPEGDARRAVQQMADLSRQGVRIRTRALITTMYARLLLGDLFIHGIGGSKYDELTDVLIERFFGLTPPAYAALSATLRLPVPLPTVEPGQEGWLAHQIRELAYHPERHLSADQLRGTAEGVSPNAQSLRSLVEQKLHWVAASPTSVNARDRFLEIHRLNEALRPAIADVAGQLRTRLEAIRLADRIRAILSSREYDFCLYPAAMLRDFLLVEVPQRLAPPG